MGNDSLIRVDSPLQAQETFEHVAVRPKPRAPAGSVAADAAIPYRFVRVHKPGQPRDKEEATKDHSHVMRWHLAQREKFLKRGRKGKNPRTTQRDRLSIAQPAHRTKSRTPIGARSLGTIDLTTDLIEQASSSTIAPHMSSTVSGHSPALHTSLQSQTSSCQNASRRLNLATRPAHFIPGRILHHDEPTPYLVTPLDRVPFPLCWFNGKLNPFDSLPVFDDTWIDVGKLKWNCSIFFGSRGLTKEWVPLLLRDRRAFLSSMAISTAHDYVMRRSSIPMSCESRETRKSCVEQMSVSAATQKMIQHSLQDPTLGYTDTTIIAVLHLLCAGVVGCNVKLIRIHSTALHAMIVKRGGLRSTNFQRPIPGIVANTMLLIATAWDTTPLPVIQEFAASQRTFPPSDPRTKVPESPAYCRPGGYMTLCEVIPRASHTYQLLDALRQLTVAFDASYSRVDVWPFRREDQVRVVDDQCLTHFNILRDRVLSHRSVENLIFSSVHDRKVYEALHLTAQIYVEALTNGITFSEAASCLETMTNGQIEQSVRTRTATNDTVPRRPAVHVQIRDALLHTNMMDCWDHMGGVLLWIAIVASAAGKGCGLASDMSRRVHLTGKQLEEEELARQYLAAVAVRADILQHFEYSTAIMGMLKNLARLQSLLRRGRDQTRIRGTASLVGRSRGSRQRLMSPQQQMLASARTVV